MNTNKRQPTKRQRAASRTGVKFPPLPRCKVPDDPMEQRRYRRCRRFVKGVVEELLNRNHEAGDPWGEYTALDEIEHRMIWHHEEYPMSWIIDIAEREFDKFDRELHLHGVMSGRPA